MAAHSSRKDESLALGRMESMVHFIPFQLDVQPQGMETEK